MTSCRHVLLAAGCCALVLAGCSSPGPVATAPATTAPATTAPATTARSVTSSPTAAGTPGHPSSTVASATSAAGPAASAPAPTAADWTTYHHDAAHTGQVDGTVSALTLRRNYALDAAVYASPLVVPSTAGRTVVVATEGGTVYGFRRDAVVWKTHIGTPVRRSALPCGNIDPLGITGTPVYDPSSRLVYGVAELADPVRHVLFAVDPSSGHLQWQVGADTPQMTARAEQQRGALNISGGKVWVPYGGLAGDCGPYIGKVVGFPLGRTAPAAGAMTVYAIPTSREAGMWQAAGVAVGADGSLYESDGNGAATGGGYDGSDSVVRLSPVDGSRQSFFAPRTWPDDNANDLDLGSMGPLLMPDGTLVQSGKRGVVFLLRQGDLGGIGGQLASTTGCRGFGGGAVAGSGSSALAVLPCTQGLTAYTTAGGRLTRAWRTSDTSLVGSPVVVGSTVLAVDPSGTLAALSSSDGHRIASVRTAPLSRFATPAVSGSTLYLGTLKGLVVVDLGATS